MSLAEGGRHLEPVVAAVAGGVIALVPLVIGFTAVVPSRLTMIFVSVYTGKMHHLISHRSFILLRATKNRNIYVNSKNSLIDINMQLTKRLMIVNVIIIIKSKYYEVRYL